MPRHPPIALKTLDRSHCQCPPARSPRGSSQQLNPVRDFRLMASAKKDQLLETCPGARLGKPIMCGRLSVSPRRTVIIITWPIKGVYGPKGQIPTTEPEQIFSSRCHTEQAAGRSRPQTLFLNE